MIPTREMSKPVFPAVVHTYTDALRVLDKAAIAVTAADLAEATSRVVSNVKRDLQKLRDADVIAMTGEQIRITDKGRAWVRGQDIAEGAELDGASPPAGLGDAPEGFVWLTYGEIQPDPNNARKTVDEEALAELADSMADKGLLQKPAVRQLEDGTHQLVAGERRWRAWGILIERNTWFAGRRELCNLLQVEGVAAEEAGLIENLQRQDLKPLDEARGFQRLIEVHGHTTASIAEKISMTQRFVQKRTQLLSLKPVDLKLMEEGKITIEEAHRRIANYPKPLEFSPELLLVFLEVADRAARLGLDVGYGQQMPVHHSMTLPDNSHGSVFYTHQDYDTMQMAVCLYYAAERALLQYTGVDSPEVEHIAAPLAAARSALGIEALSEGVYATAWLNAPYDPDPAKAAARAQQNAEREADDADRAKARAQSEERYAKGAEVTENILKALEAEPPGSAHDDIALAFELFGKPLPWRVDSHNQLVAANGAFVQNVGRVDPHKALMFAAINAAGGFATPPNDEADAGLARDAFEAAMSARLREIYTDETEAAAAARATKLLDGYLADNAIAFGDPEGEWTADAAVELTDQLDADDMALSGDDDEEFEVAEGAGTEHDEPSAAIKALAGIPAEATS